MSETERPRPKLCFVTAVPMTVSAFLNAHIERLAESHDVFVVSNFSTGVPTNLNHLATCIHVPIYRHISPWADAKALVCLWRVIRRGKFSIVQTVTPKAGLLGMLAAWLAGAKIRVHWFTGQVWATKGGVARQALKWADKLIAGLASALLADSHSQRQFLLREGVCHPDKIDVIADGSICGVDLVRFQPSPTYRAAIRTQYAIPEEASLILYLGRLSKDKGLTEMAAAAVMICASVPAAHFLIVGPDEADMAQVIRDKTHAYVSRIHFAGHTSQPEQFMAAADIFCLPSYREGFGSVVIEAAAVGVPTVASKIYGLEDAVEDGVTGLLVPARDAPALAAALQILLLDEDKRREMGAMSRQRATQTFSRQRIVDGLLAYYQELQNHA